MAETRQIGNSTIHFLGPNASSLAADFDGLYDRNVSSTFVDTVDQGASRFGNIYVGSGPSDFQGIPGDPGFNTSNPRIGNAPGYGQAVGNDYFMVVTGRQHDLRDVDGQMFEGSTQ